MAETDPIQELRKALAKATTESSTHARLEVQRLSALAAPALLAKLADAEEKVASHEGALRMAHSIIKHNDATRERLGAENAQLREGVAGALAALQPVRIANIIVNDVWKRLAALASSVQPSPASDAQGPGVDGWSFDMGSAPKDGTLILVALMDRADPPRLKVRAAYWASGRWYSRPGVITTHWEEYAWRPMLAPPAPPVWTAEEIAAAELEAAALIRDVFPADPLPAPPAVSEPSTTGVE